MSKIYNRGFFVMFYELDKLVPETTIVAVQPYEDEIFMFDKNFKLYRFNSDRKLTSRQTLIANQEMMHSYSSSVSFDPFSKKMLLPYGTKPLGLYLDLNAKPKVIKKLNEPRKTLECTAFSTQGSYIAVGDASGRCNVFHAKSAQLITELPPRPDYISSLEFSSNERFLASASYDKCVVIFDLVLNVEVASITTTDVVQSITFFDNDRGMVMLQRNGAMQVYHIDDQVLDREKNLFPSWPTSSLLSEDGRFVFVGLKNGSLCAVNLETQEKAFDEKVCHSGITKMVLHEGLLIIAQEKSSTLLIDTHHQLENFVNALRVKDHSRLNEMITSNIFLILNEEYDAEMIGLYEPLFKRVNFLIQKGKIEPATTLIAPYENDPKIMGTFELMIKNQEHIQTLAALVSAQQIVDAYNLIQKYPILKDVPAAIELELTWQAAFGKAKRLCKTNEVTSHKEAERILAPYERVVEKQTEIHAILKNTKVFIEADKYVAAKKFKEYFALVERYAFLTKSPVHQNIIQMSHKILGQLKQALHASDFQKCKDYITFLAPFSNIRAEYVKLVENFKVRVAFFQALQKNDVDTIFSMAKEHNELRTLREYETIENRFKELSKKALDFAFIADVRGIKEVFGNYTTVKLFEDKIASLIKIAYLNQMRKEANNPKIDWQSVFSKFITYYGKSDDLLFTARQINQIEILKKIKLPNNPEGYKKEALVDSILG